MNFKKENLEKQGLKIDKNRVLIYSQLSCPLGCKYCFAGDLNFNQKENASYLSTKQIELINKLPEDINLIMLGCDTEFLQNKEEALTILKKLSNLNKDISIVTKLLLSENFIEELKKIDNNLRKNGNIFVFSMSVPCLDSAKNWEPGVPSPKDRIEVLKNVYEKGIKTSVALRPLLPTVSDKELEKIIDLTKNYCSGYYSGPLYLKEIDNSLLDFNNPDFKIEKIQPH